MSGNGFFFLSKVAGIHRYLQSIFTNITTSYTSLITALKSFIIKINKMDIFNMDHLQISASALASASASALRKKFFQLTRDFFEKIEHLCLMRLNILRCALLSQQVRIMAFSIHIVYTEIAMVRKHLSAAEIACTKIFHLV